MSILWWTDKVWVKMAKGEIRRKIRHLFTRLEDLIEAHFNDRVHDSQIFCIRIIIIQYQQILRMGQALYSESTRRAIDVLWDCARRNETSLIHSFTLGTIATAERQEPVQNPNIIEGEVYEYHSDDEQD